MRFAISRPPNNHLGLRVVAGLIFTVGVLLICAEDFRSIWTQILTELVGGVFIAGGGYVFYRLYR